MISDLDLIQRHRRIGNILPPGIPNFSSYRDIAWEVINRDLIKKGRRPELILSSFALVDMHVYKSLELIFRDAITFVGDGRYAELANMYADKYVEEWQEIQLIYDRDENDAIDPGEKEAVSPSMFLGVPPGYPSYTIKGR